MIVCVYTLKKRFVIRNKTLRHSKQNASSFETKRFVSLIKTLRRFISDKRAIGQNNES